MRPSKSTPRFLHRRHGNAVHIKTCTCVSVHGSIIPKLETTLCCSSAGEWIDRMWWHIWNIIWQLKGKEVLIRATTWMNFKTIILSERRLYKVCAAPSTPRGRMQGFDLVHPPPAPTSILTALHTMFACPPPPFMYPGFSLLFLCFYLTDEETEAQGR